MNQPPQRDDTFENVVMVLLFLFIGLLLIVWAAGNLASLVAHGQVLGASFEDAGHAMFQLRHHLGDPRSAWPPELGARLPGPVLYWAATAVVVAAAVVIGVGAHKVFRDPVEPLDRRRRAGVSAQGRLARRSDLHPLLVRRPQPDRFVLGRVGHRLIATEATTTTTRRRRQTAGRGAVMPVGPSRSGKTTSIINGVFHWRHPAVLVSLKGDFLDVTGTWRDSLGDVQVFDPSGVTGHESATWSPLRGATTVSGAVRAARQIAEAAPRQQSTEHGDFWSNMAESLLAALLVVAANSENRTFADVVRWVVGTDVPGEGFAGEVQPLVRALKGDGEAQRKEAGRFATTVLEGLWRNDHRTVSSVYATGRTMVWPWIDPLVARSTASCTIDLDWLLEKNNTLYVCIPLNDQHRLRPVLGGLLNDLVGQAFEHFVQTNKPLDPPLLLVIDEAATLRPDQLPSWASTLSGVGVQLVTAWQSIAQIEAAYGRQAPAILTNHMTKLFFPGMSDATGLDYLSQLLGDEHVASRLGGQPNSDPHRPAITSVPLVPPASLRQLRAGDALMVHGTLPPAHLRIRPWYRDWRLRRRASG
ncbi:MAG TPA: type IV secretory system conjugative DNA transfer family protein [Acidimicrobiales bacterium]|nr:type IV secretory system conjugative DNA transfer family protein [Acidimicrobiales bacterium]